MILVTGGTGLVGSHLLYNLCKTNEKIVAIYRNEETQKNTKEIFELYGDSSNYINIEWKKADITNIPSLKIAFENITHVYHAAAVVSFDSSKEPLLRKVNIEGTANIVNLCLANNIQKLCYVSSIATLSKTPGIKYIDEEANWNPEEDHSDYSISKYGAEMEVWRGSQEGLSVVIVNPGVIFGFGCWNVNTGKLFKQVKNGMPFYTKGITGVVDVKDVVKAMTLLMNSSIESERFVLVTDNKDHQTTLTTIANYLSVKPPKLKANLWLTETAWAFSYLISKISFGAIKPQFYKHNTRASHKQSLYNGSKIKKSIAFNYTPFESSIKEIASKLS